MEPITEVRDVAIRLAALSEETVDLIPALTAVSNLARALLPSVVGVSITVLVEGEPFTVTATSEELKVVDAAQYIDGGPCVHAAATGDQVSVSDVLDERRWELYARAAAANGIRASMSLPLHGIDGRSRRAGGALNLYASEAGAFDGKEQQLAALFGVQADELVANADLSFMTRGYAQELPQRLVEHEQVREAVRVLMELHGWSEQDAWERLDYAAGHAGTSRASVARTVMVLDT